MIRKITYRQLYILVATLLAVTSCTGDDTLTDTKVPMTFACNAIAQTRAEGEYVAYDGPAFGVAAMHHAQSNRPTADVTTYIDNAQVSKQRSAPPAGLGSGLLALSWGCGREPRQAGAGPNQLHTSLLGTRALGKRRV